MAKFKAYFRDTSYPDANVFGTDNPEYWEHGGMERLTQKAGAAAVKEQSRQHLLSLLKLGDSVWVKVTKVAPSGMSRHMRAYIPTRDDDTGKLDILDISAYVAEVIGERMSDNGIQMTGCGMDMTFQLVYLLGSYLWPDGTPEPHGTRNGEPDTAGGYALISLQRRLF